MGNIAKGITAGIVATVVLSVLMVAKSMMGLMPQLDVISMLSRMMGVAVPVAWVIHFMIGAIWGALFAVLYKAIPGKEAVAKGLVFGSAAWLLMMLMIMPMAGAGLFGMKLGMIAPVMTWMLHLVFGSVLGLVYARRAR
ncbi:DUF6789 family protein [Pseudoxanthomonas japonensis]|uniref:DUF6789 family protein n=1 Tax=Pseudoxanthomonas japonensis TaxID=69284 RepID=UPI00374A5ECA